MPRGQKTNSTVTLDHCGARQVQHQAGKGTPHKAESCQMGPELAEMRV